MLVYSTGGMGLFDGRGDAKGNHRGLIRRFSESIKERRSQRQQKREAKKLGSKNSKDADTSSESSDDQVEAYANSFINEEQLGDFDPSGHADMSVVGTTPDAALDMDFQYNESSPERADVRLFSLQSFCLFFVPLVFGARFLLPVSKFASSTLNVATSSTILFKAQSATCKL